MSPHLKTPNTKILDHIVHLTPPGTVEQTSQQFSDLGFTVIPGGTHTDGLTSNALVLLADGVYLELLSFTNPVSSYPPGSPERKKRESHNWAKKSPGWIDYAFLGNGVLSPRHGNETRISDVINERAKRQGSAASGRLYKAEFDGGRQRSDGRLLKWVITSPENAVELGGALPFFCGDITPREWRVPTTSDNTSHPSQALGISHILFLTPSASSLRSLIAKIMSVTGSAPSSTSSTSATWLLNTVHQTLTGPSLILSVPTDEEQKAWVEEFVGHEDVVGEEKAGIYEVGFRVKKGGKEESTEKTPFGRVRWVQE